MIPWWAFSLLANVTITAIEYLNRTGGYPSFGHALLRTAPLILIAQWGLFRSWRDAPSLLVAWAFFSVGNCVMRIGSAYFAVQEPPSWLTLAGVALMMFGAYVVKVG